MHLERDHGIGPDRLEKRSDIARRYWIVRLGTAILSRITEVWRDGGYSPGASILQRSDEKQQPAELVVGALPRASVKAMDHVYVGAGNGIEWPRLVLAIFEIPFLMRAKRVCEQLTDISPELVGTVQGEQSKLPTGNRPDRARRPNLIFHHGSPRKTSRSFK